MILKIIVIILIFLLVFYSISLLHHRIKFKGSYDAGKNDALRNNGELLEEE